MAEGDENLSTDQRVRRSVARTLGDLTITTVVLGVLGVWLSLGVYTLDPGEAAVLLRLGKHVGTVSDPGVHWALPPPITTREIANVGMVRNEDFGVPAPGESVDSAELLHESSMQTSDNNIVRVSFTVQYTVKDPFEARFRLADAPAVVRDAAQAAMREVVGRTTVDGVLREKKALVTSEAERLLQEILDSYGSGLQVTEVQLQDVQPPAEVRAAFGDVVAANQDASRLVNEAEGHRNEVLPKARAEAAEVTAQAEAYRVSKVAQATGAAERFRALAVEYRKAPEVTKKRLYLETMEQVMPKVEKVIVEPGTTSVMPYLPLGRDGEKK